MNRNPMIIVTVIAAGFLVSSGPAVMAASLKKTDGKVLEGSRIKWFETRREYQVENADGSMLPVPFDEVESVEVDKPAEFDKAVQAVAAKQYDAAIPILEDLVLKYRRLQWDAKSREVLAKACVAKGDFKKSAQVLGDLMSNTPKSQITDEQHVLYWSALLGAQMTATLKKDLNETLAGDSKSLAALAMIKRGDINKSEGKRDDAVLDFMRVVILYDEVREAQPEALFKAAQLLGEMRDTARADELKKKLVSLYPASVYAKKLGGGL